MVGRGGGGGGGGVVWSGREGADMMSGWLIDIIIYM